MINFLHTFQPQRVLVEFGFLKVHYYGLFIVIGMLLAITIAIKLSKYYNIDKNKIFDLAFWAIIFGILSARIYAVFLFLPYYLENPLDVFKIWEGGLAIHGAIIGGVLTVYFFAKKEKINFWILSSLVAPGLALAQAIGRWGNYFNQELFGLPTNLPIGIPISFMNRPNEYISTEFFHPTFLYESIGNLLIFLILISVHILIIKKKKFSELVGVSVTVMYLIFYSILRFSLEFVRIDDTPEFFGLRTPQLASLIIIAVSLIFISIKIKKRNEAV